MTEKMTARIRVRLESFNHELLGSSCQKNPYNLTKHDFKFGRYCTITDS